MCCLDKQNYTCCCGCTLTTGTWILGILIMIEMIFSFIYGQWLSAVSQAILVVPFILTMFDKHNVTYRKFLFYLYVAAFVLWLIVMIIILVVWTVYTGKAEYIAISLCNPDYKPDLPIMQDWFGDNIEDCTEAMRNS